VKEDEFIATVEMHSYWLIVAIVLAISLRHAYYTIVHIIYVERERKVTLRPTLFKGTTVVEELICRNITSRGHVTPTVFEETNLDLPCTTRGTCDKTFIFVICPPFSGSTAIYSLLSTSAHAVTLLESGAKVGEGQWLYFQKDKGKEKLRYKDEDGFFNATLYSEVIREAWRMNNTVNASVFIEKSPPNIFRAHKLYNEFRKIGRVRFLLMLQGPCYSRFDITKYLGYVEYAQVLLSQFKEITLYIRYEELLLNLESEIGRIKIAFPEISDIDPTKQPKGNFPGKRSIPLSDYIKSIPTIDHMSGAPHLVPKHASIKLDEVSYTMLKNLGLIEE
jgi:hypothetical protein